MYLIGERITVNYSEGSKLFHALRHLVWSDALAIKHDTQRLISQSHHRKIGARQEDGRCGYPRSLLPCLNTSASLASTRCFSVNSSLSQHLLWSEGRKAARGRVASSSFSLYIYMYIPHTFTF